MIDYPALSAVAAVIREGSFERAAISLGITPSAVSQRVRGYEERIGAVLIVRDQPCTPTELGRLLCAHYDQVQLLEADLAPALTSVGETHELPPTVKVAVNADSLATWFPSAAASFADRTGMSLEIRMDDETHTAEHLRAGEVSAAVTAAHKPVPGFKTIPLGALQYTACASPAFVTRYFRHGVNAASLGKAPYLRFNRKDVLQARWAKEACDVDLIAPTHWVPAAQGFRDFALLGLAWGVMPTPLVEPDLEKGQLVELPPELVIEVDLFWTVARLQAASLRALTEAVRTTARDWLGPQNASNSR